MTSINISLTIFSGFLSQFVEQFVNQEVALQLRVSECRGHEHQQLGGGSLPMGRGGAGLQGGEPVPQHTSAHLSGRRRRRRRDRAHSGNATRRKVWKLGKANQ